MNKPRHKSDALLLSYIAAVKKLFLTESPSFKTYQKEIGFTQDQTSCSLYRLQESGFIVYENGYYTVAPNQRLDIYKIVRLPFISDEFFDAWEIYKQYRVQEHKSGYKSPISEQAAVNKLHKLVSGNDTLAIQSLEETMSNRWIGFEHGFNKIIEQSKQSSGTTEGRTADIFNRVFKGR